MTVNTSELDEGLAALANATGLTIEQVILQAIAEKLWWAKATGVLP
jgi:hypothetical protein